MSTSPASPPANESPAARRSAPITREAVFEAAYALTKAGSRPTIERIRLYLGNGTPRGSPNTVNVFLTQWWEELAVRLAGGPVEAIHGLPPSVSGTLETLWNQALGAARDKWRKELADQERELLERAHALKQKAQALSEREQVLEARAAALEQALTLAREQLAAANQRAETLEATEVRRTGEIQVLQEHCRSSDADIRELQRKFEAERTELARRSELERAELARRFDATEARQLRDLEQARQLARERAQEAKRAAAEARAATKQRDRLQRQLVKAQAKRPVRQATPAAPRPRRRAKGPVNPQ